MQIIRKGVCAQEGDQTFVETVDRLWIFGMQEKKTVSAYAAKKFATSVALEMDPQKLPGRGSAAVEMRLHTIENNQISGAQGLLPLAVAQISLARLGQAQKKGIVATAFGEIPLPLGVDPHGFHVMGEQGLFYVPDIADNAFLNAVRLVSQVLHGDLQ